MRPLLIFLCAVAYLSFAATPGLQHEMRFDFGPPVNLGPAVNSPAFDGGPSVSADGLYLFFSSDRPGGHGKRDLWVAARAGRAAPFGRPRNLGPLVNSVAHDVRPSITVDGSALFFMSDRPGGAGQIDLWEAANRASTRPRR